MRIVKTFLEFVAENSISEGLKYHVENKLPLTESVFRFGSDSFFKLINEARSLSDKLELTELDNELLKTDIGMMDLYEGNLVYLDYPHIEDETINETKEHVKLNKPRRSTGDKKYVVYVKNPKTGKIKKIEFGDLKGGLTSKINDKEARLAFAKRHQCHLKKDKTTPGYWSCNLPRYAKLLGLAGGGNYYW